MPNAATAALRGGEHAHRVIRNHLDDFLRTAADRANGCCLPEFIAREFREFLTCGVLAHGLARVRCERCALERLVPFTLLAALTPRPGINLVLYHGGAGPTRTLAAGGRRLPRHGEGPGERFPRGGWRSAQAPLLDVGSADAPRLRPGRSALSALRRADAADHHDRRPGRDSADPCPSRGCPAGGRIHSPRCP